MLHASWRISFFIGPSISCTRNAFGCRTFMGLARGLHCQPCRASLALFGKGWIHNGFYNTLFSTKEFLYVYFPPTSTPLTTFYTFMALSNRSTYSHVCFISMLQKGCQTVSREIIGSRVPYSSRENRGRSKGEFGSRKTRFALETM